MVYMNDRNVDNGQYKKDLKAVKAERRSAQMNVENTTKVKDFINSRNTWLFDFDGVLTETKWTDEVGRILPKDNSSIPLTVNNSRYNYATPIVPVVKFINKYLTDKNVIFLSLCSSGGAREAFCKVDIIKNNIVSLAAKDGSEFFVGTNSAKGKIDVLKYFMNKNENESIVYVDDNLENLIAYEEQLNEIDTCGKIDLLHMSTLINMIWSLE